MIENGIYGIVSMGGRTDRLMVLDFPIGNVTVHTTHTFRLLSVLAGWRWAALWTERVSRTGIYLQRDDMIVNDRMGGGTD